MSMMPAAAPDPPERSIGQTHPAQQSTGDRQPQLSRPSAATPPPPSPPKPSLPAPSLPLKPSTHTKTHHSCMTPDGWRLHLVHTRPTHAPHTTIPSAQGPQLPAPPRHFPVILCPGLGSSGAYTFDLSPVVSLADYLAARGWDVWTVELRGNGQSDRPRLFVRSRWWTIDDYVTKDLPAVLQYVRKVSGKPKVHVLGHSMGGMILTRLLALGGEPAAAVASAIVVGSGCFLQGSWWQALEGTMWLARFLWLVPAGATLRAYSPLAMGRAGLPLLDELYFWPPNTDPVLARAVLARNFSAISSGVIVQIGSAFGPLGLRTADGRESYADPLRLARVETPVLFICGDRDRMCPPQGAAATCALFTGSRCARFIELGPKYGTRHHYGHFDILMGRHAEEEVFPTLAAWLEEHDGAAASTASATAATRTAAGADTAVNGTDTGVNSAKAAAPTQCQVVAAAASGWEEMPMSPALSMQTETSALTALAARSLADGAEGCAPAPAPVTLPLPAGCGPSGGVEGVARLSASCPPGAGPCTIGVQPSRGQEGAGEHVRLWDLLPLQHHQRQQQQLHGHDVMELARAVPAAWLESGVDGLLRAGAVEGLAAAGAAALDYGLAYRTAALRSRL